MAWYSTSFCTNGRLLVLTLTADPLTVHLARLQLDLGNVKKRFTNGTNLPFITSRSFLESSKVFVEFEFESVGLYALEKRSSNELILHIYIVVEFVVGAVVVGENVAAVGAGTGEVVVVGVAFRRAQKIMA